MKQPIWNINDDFEPENEQELNHSDFYDDIEDWYSEDEELDCWACAGTGEGQISDSRCSYCHGRGTIKKKKY